MYSLVVVLEGKGRGLVLVIEGKGRGLTVVLRGNRRVSSISLHNFDQFGFFLVIIGYLTLGNLNWS